MRKGDPMVMVQSGGELEGRGEDGRGQATQGAGLWHECSWALKPLTCSDLPRSFHSEAMEVGKSTCMFDGRYEVVA